MAKRTRKGVLIMSELEVKKMFLNILNLLEDALFDIEHNYHICDHIKTVEQLKDKMSTKIEDENDSQR